MARIDIKNLPKAVKIIIAILPAILLAVGIAYFMVLPKQDDIEKLEKNIAKQERDISKAQNMVQKLAELKKKNKQLRADLKELEEFLPEEKEISSLLKQVSDLGRDANLEILSWNPAAKKRHSSGIINEVPVSVTLVGSYHRLGRFFSSLTTLDRIVTVKNITLGGAKTQGNEAVLSVSFSAATYTAIESTAQKGKNKRR